MYAATEHASSETLVHATTDDFRNEDAIGRLAAELVDDGSLVILDAGTTTEFVARHLDVSGVTVFTNSIGVINILLRNEDVSMVVLGGRLRSLNGAISGAEAENMLRSVVADYAFIGADAVHPHYGIASRTMEQSRLKTLMTQRARRTVVVTDSRKLYTDEFNYWSPLPTEWLLITDDLADPEALDSLRSVGAQTVATNPNEDLGAQPDDVDGDDAYPGSPELRIKIPHLVAVSTSATDGPEGLADVVGMSRVGPGVGRSSQSRPG